MMDIGVSSSRGSNTSSAGKTSSGDASGQADPFGFANALSQTGNGAAGSKTKGQAASQGNDGSPQGKAANGASTLSAALADEADDADLTAEPEIPMQAAVATGGTSPNVPAAVQAGFGAQLAQMAASGTPTGKASAPDAKSSAAPTDLPATIPSSVNLATGKAASTAIPLANPKQALPSLPNPASPADGTASAGDEEQIVPPQAAPVAQVPTQGGPAAQVTMQAAATNLSTIISAASVAAQGGSAQGGSAPATGTEGAAKVSSPKGAAKADKEGPEADLKPQEGLSAADLLSLLAGSGATAANAAQAPTSEAKADANGQSSKPSAVAGQVAVPTQPATDAIAIRIGRADGKGQGIELNLSKADDGSTAVDGKLAAGNGAVDVTVLDSRRYLGFSMAPNSSLVLNSMTGNSDWHAAMGPQSTLANQAAWSSTGNVVNTLKIEMNPERLGTVTATMRLSGDQLTVDLKVQSDEAYRQLSNDQNSIMAALKSQGYSVDQMTVSISSAANNNAPNSGSNNQQNPSAQTQQQAMGNQGQGSQGHGDGQARRQNFSGSTNGMDTTRPTSVDVTADRASAPSSRTRPSSLYL